MWLSRKGVEEEKQMFEVEIHGRMIEMNRVIERVLKGQNDPTKIAKDLGLKRSEVLDYIDEWKQIAANDDNIKARAREALVAMDEHYSLIINRLWETVEQADLANDTKSKTTTLKAIADIEAKRQESLQKAGLYDDAELGDELALMEERAEAIKKLLTNIASKYPDTKMEIMMGLKDIFGQAGPIPGEVVVAPGN